MTVGYVGRLHRVLCRGVPGFPRAQFPGLIDDPEADESAHGIDPATAVWE